MSNNTLESQHKTHLKNFDNNSNLIKKNAKKISQYKAEFEKINKKSIEKMTQKNIKRKIFLKNEIEKIEKQNINYENNTDKFKYYLNTMDIFEQYYSKPKKQKETTTITKNKFNFFKGEKVLNKTKLYNSYLSKLNKNVIEEKNEKLEDEICCVNCNHKKMLNQTECTFVCPNCGHCTDTLMESDKPNYNETTIEISSFSYRRYSHFCEWLNQFRAIETTNIPEEVYEQIRAEIKKEKIKNIKSIKYDKMKRILKKTGQTKYYEHTYHIMNKITGVPPPKITNELVRNLQIMFKKIQEPFAKICPEDRVNFLRYSYVIRKFLELLDETDLIKHFQLLKSREVLYEQDMMWKSICEQIDWPFYPSI